MSTIKPIPGSTRHPILDWMGPAARRNRVTTIFRLISPPISAFSKSKNNLGRCPQGVEQFAVHFVRVQAEHEGAPFERRPCAFVALIGNGHYHLRLSGISELPESKSMTSAEGTAGLASTSCRVTSALDSAMVPNRLMTIKRPSRIASVMP